MSLRFLSTVIPPILIELLLGLAAQVAPVHQEQHPPRPTKLDQPVDEADRREGLARTRGHLDQGARLVGGQRRFQVADGDDLRWPELEVGSLGDQLRHLPDAGQECAHLPGGQRLGQTLGVAG